MKATNSWPPRNFGAVIVKDGEILGQGHNHVYEDNDPSAHAEITSIRAAAQKLGTKDLSGCIMYGSHEPCLMCFSCAGWANIDRIVYAHTANEQNFSYEFDGVNLQDLAKKFTRRNVSVEHVPLHN
jgi:tRNA(Arg) A34 adenosine deaminase TadA